VALFRGTLDGAVAVVTGGAGGIGRAIAEALLDAAAAVVVSSRRQDAIDETVGLLAGRGTIAGVAADVTDRDDVERLFAEVRDRHGAVDVLVCSHGLYAETPFLELSDDEWRTIVDVNLRGCFLAGQVAGRQMAEAGRGGRMVLIGSLAAYGADRGAAAYSASKAGVHLLARGMAHDLARDRITVNVVDPGFIRSPMSEPYIAGMTNPQTGKFKLNPVGRPGEPSDIANAVLWLVQPATEFVTGQTIVVDGGERAILHQLWLEP